MLNRNKKNKELLYSIIFFIAAIMWFYLNLLDQIRNKINLSSDSLSIKYKLLDWHVYSLFSHVSEVAIVGSVIFLLCSAYLGIKSMRKHPVGL